jgi:P pilus assembly chaperone PapD
MLSLREMFNEDTSIMSKHFKNPMQRREGLFWVVVKTGPINKNSKLGKNMLVILHVFYSPSQ